MSNLQRLVGSGGHFARRNNWKRTGASNIAGKPEPSLDTTGQSFRWRARQGLDAVKVGCGEKAVDSKRGEIHRLPEATRRQTESETTVAAQSGTFLGKVHVTELLVGFLCLVCSASVGRVT